MILLTYFRDQLFNGKGKYFFGAYF